MRRFGWQRVVAACGFGALAAFVTGPGAAGGMTLTADSVSDLSEGQSAKVCVRMDSGGQKIAGVQNDLNWDGNCLAFGGCQANLAHGKSLHMPKAPAGNSTKALLLALDNLDPIPDGELYCCTFTVKSASPGGCCPVNITGALGSDPQGNAVRSGANGGRLCMRGTSALGGGPGRPGAAAGPGVVSNVPEQPVPPADAVGAATRSNVDSGGGPAAAPAAQVFAGGGGPAPAAPAAPGVPPVAPAAGPASAAPTPAAGAPGAAAPALPPGAPAAQGTASAAAPTAAATSVASKPPLPTQPRAAATATVKRAATPTEKVSGNSGWGCQIAGVAPTGWPLAAFAAVLVLARRRG